jgi:hypothetical protein
MALVLVASACSIDQLDADDAVEHLPAGRRVGVDQREHRCAAWAYQGGQVCPGFGVVLVGHRPERGYVDEVAGCPGVVFGVDRFLGSAESGFSQDRA